MNSARFGFTLVELLIVVSIITIISGAAIPSFSRYIDNQNLKQAQEMLKDDLRNVQSRALSGEQATTIINGTQVAYWEIEFVADQPTYSQYIATHNTNCSGTNRTLIKTSTALPGGNVIRKSVCVFFSFKNGDATWTGGGGTTNVTVGPLGGAAATSCRRITLYPYGLIDIGAGTSCL